MTVTRAEADARQLAYQRSREAWGYLVGVDRSRLPGLPLVLNLERMGHAV